MIHRSRTTAKEFEKWCQAEGVRPGNHLFAAAMERAIQNQIREMSIIDFFKTRQLERSSQHQRRPIEHLTQYLSQLPRRYRPKSSDDPNSKGV